MLHSDRKVQNILDLADFIEKLPADQYSQCNSGLCIWGHAKKLFRAGYQLDELAEHLGIDHETAIKIIHAYPYAGIDTWPPFRQPTTADAARMLRHLAVTGEVVWPK